MYAGFLGLLGATEVEVNTMRTWLPEWKKAYLALSISSAPIRLHPHRWFYYERGVDAILSGPTAQAALWPLWRTWTHAICALPADSPLRVTWQKAGEQIGLLGEAFFEKIAGLDAYLDMVEELLDTWARENGG
jgi:hypothetical protein